MAVTILYAVHAQADGLRTSRYYGQVAEFPDVLILGWKDEWGRDPYRRHHGAPVFRDPAEYGW